LADLVHRKALFQILIFAVYLSLALLLTYPLITHFFTHVMGTDIWAFDEYTFIWNMWWFKYSVLESNSNPLFSDHIFYPLGISLILYTYNLFDALMSVPLQTFLPLPAIANMINVLSLALSGYGTYLLLRYLLRRDREPAAVRPLPVECAAFLGGVVYAFTAYHFVYAALGHNEMITTQWLPLYVLFLTKTLDEKRLLNPVLAGLFATLAMLCDMLFGVFLVFMTLVVFGFVGRRRTASLDFLRRFGLLLLTCLLSYWPIGLPVLREFLGAEYALEGWGHSDKLLVDLLGFITPTALHPILGTDWTQELIAVREGTARFVDVNTVFVGWIVVALAVLASVKCWARLKAWVLGAVASAVLAMGPLLHINGQSTFDLDGLLINVPLPFILLHYVPFVNANRVPHRFSAVLMLCLAVLAGFAAHIILGWVKRREVTYGACALLSLAILFEHLSVPMPLTDARVPSWYQTLAEEPGDFAILEFPLGWRNSFGVFGVERTQAQYYQSTHQKRLPSGNISRNPPFKIDYFRRIPIFGSIARLEMYEELDPSIVERDRSLADDLVYFFDIRYLVFQPIIANRPPYSDTRQQVEDYVQEVFPLEGVYQDEAGLTVYRVEQPPGQTELTIDFGTEPAVLNRGEGWSRDEIIGDTTANWANSRKAHVYVPLRETGDYEMTFRALAFRYEGAPDQTVEILVNGHRMPESFTIGPYWDIYGLTLPAGHLQSGLNEITVIFSYAASPRDVLPGNFQVGETGAASPVEITVNSAGHNAGDFAYITVEGTDASTHRRGYNLAVIDPTTGNVVSAAGFDTFANEFESQDMVDFITAIPQGQIVAVAVKGDGAANLTAEAVEALGSLGGGIDLRDTQDLSHALIGVKGAPRGTALEASGEGNSYLHVGKNPDERTLSVALDYVTLSLE
jgi:hypothetical protein